MAVVLCADLKAICVPR